MIVNIHRKTHTMRVTLAAEEVEKLSQLLAFAKGGPVSEAQEAFRARAYALLYPHCDYCGEDGASCTCEWQDEDHIPEDGQGNDLDWDGDCDERNTLEDLLP